MAGVAANFFIGGIQDGVCKSFTMTKLNPIDGLFNKIAIHDFMNDGQSSHVTGKCVIQFFMDKIVAFEGSYFDIPESQLAGNAALKKSA